MGQEMAEWHGSGKAAARVGDQDADRPAAVLDLVPDGLNVLELGEADGFAAAVPNSGHYAAAGLR